MFNHWCQLCGQPLGRWCFFTGGELCAEQNAYFEPACHLDCLVYAMQVCPFILGKMEHADIEKVKRAHPDIDLGEDSAIVASKPMEIRWIITKATNWSYGRTEQKTIMCIPSGSNRRLHVQPATMNAQDWQRAFEYLSAHDEPPN